ncbi:hypothetical protein Dalk_4574 [Desulfatibacillum aliphaticivorans]|uniref:Uncharacterized protein n=1 Tax=Desulfatibacillum aliphaticivorans TaxID=218208 RepID=B8FNH1_DESAL|nr:hypothetical protein [Desulfatibacillum aliphaticivorans]ACL06252.1 hypothetical protein Dalk_4574 [Desulfatibacillum aliphaticivorans]
MYKTTVRGKNRMAALARYLLDSGIDFSVKNIKPDYYRVECSTDGSVVESILDSIGYAA